MQDDNALMRRVKDGDKQAFETLVLRHRESALKLAARYVSDPYLAEDVVQECFADLYLHAGAYKTDFSFTTFLNALVRHKSADLLRKRRHSPLPLTDTPEGESAETPESLCVRREIYTGLYRAIDELNGRQRKMLMLFAVHGQDYRQIAAGLNITVPQVKVGLHRIRKKLKKAREDWT